MSGDLSLSRPGVGAPVVEEEELAVFLEDLWGWGAAHFQVGGPTGLGCGEGGVPLKEAGLCVLLVRAWHAGGREEMPYRGSAWPVLVSIPGSNGFDPEFCL